MTTIEPLIADGVFDPPAYSQCLKVTGADAILFLSGQVSYAADGGVEHAGDFKGQARSAFAAIKALVEAAGGTMASVVKLNIFVTDMMYRNDYGLVRAEFFPGKSPASTLVEISALAHPDWKIEIEAIAVL